MSARLLLLAASFAFASPDRGPGEAGTAMAENEERLEANPALLGSDAFDKRFHARLTLPSVRLPVEAWDDVSPHMDLLETGNPDKILADKSFVDALWSFDNRPVSVGAGMGIAFWKDHWGVSMLLWSHPGVMLDHGVVIPQISVWDSTDLHIRAGLSQPFGATRVGVGLHVRGRTGSTITTSLRDPSRLSDEIEGLQDSVKKDFSGGVSELGAGLDLGVLHQLPWDIQFGMRLGDIGMRDADDEFERPSLDAAIAWIPSAFRAGPRWSRRVSVGMGFRDLLDSESPLLGRFDLGASVRHNLSPRGTELRTGVGLRGGWPTADLGLTLGPVLLDASVWTRDLDAVLGQSPQEFWDFRMQLGW